MTAAEDDRADMIIDNDTDEGNDAAQSDLVRVALNLAFIPESSRVVILFVMSGICERAV